MIQIVPVIPHYSTEGLQRVYPINMMKLASDSKIHIMITYIS